MPVRLIVARVHYEKLHIKIKLVVMLKLLKKLCHEHGILTARDTHCNLIPRLYKLIGIYRLCKLAPDGFLKFLSDALLHICLYIALCHLILFHGIKQPAYIASL